MTSSTFEAVGTPLTLTPGDAAWAAGTMASTPRTASSRQRRRGPLGSMAVFASVLTFMRLNVRHRGWTPGRYLGLHADTDRHRDRLDRRRPRPDRSPGRPPRLDQSCANRPNRGHGVAR